MATITTDLICNLNQPVAATFLHGNLFSQDNAGNTINVYVLDNGAPATIGGTVSANVIRSDGNTVAVSGAIDGNKAYVILPQACYAVPGRVEIIIKLTQNTTITTIAAIVANVYRSTTDTVVDPGTIIPSISSLIAQIEAAVDSIPVDYSGLLATIAGTYSSSKTYKVGDYAWEAGVLKRCIVPITAGETFTAAHWTNAVIGDDLSALKSAITENKTYADWESGGLNPANGGNTTNAARIRLTKYVGINNNIPYALALTGYEFSIFAWNNSTGVYVGMYTTGNVFATSGTAKWVGSFDFAAYPNYKFRVVLRNAVITTASISTSEATNCVFSVNRFDTDETLTKEHVAADAKKTGEMKSAIKTIDGVEILSFESGGMYQETGIDYNDATKSKTKFVKVNPGSFIRFMFDSNISSSIAVYEFASNDETTVSVNNRLAVRGPGNGVTIQLSSSTNYIRVQVNVATSAITSPFLLVQSGTVFQIKGTLPNNTSFNSVIGENCIYIISSTNTYTDVPESYPYGGLLIVCHPSASITNHIFINNNPNGSNWQRYYSSGSETWGNWKKSDGVVNNYTFPTYEYTYNVSASPEITTDTNNYLASTGDTTDRATDIQTLLNTTGYCHLGPGDFYITGVAMPSASCIEGCGNKTRVFLKSSVTDGFAFKLPTYGTIKNMRIIGSTGTHTPSSTVGTRHGILFEGDASAVSPSNIPYRGIISDVMISDFNGGGITLYNTGLAPSASVSVTNAYIVRCDAGIYIPYYSEFSRFTNVSCGECYYGCVNNGGNNYFANCSFSKNILGLLMDNSESQSPNCGHGAFVACNFHHSNSNNGTAIRALNIPHGELFNGCQIGYGSVEVEDCKRIVFSGCSFLASVPISIEDSIATLFGTCTFVDGSTITVTNSATTHFDNCYDDTGTAVNPMS